MKPIAAVVATALLILAGFAGATPAMAATGSAKEAATVPAPVASGPLTLELTQLTPRVVTDDGPATITVLGTLRNTGDRLVDDLSIRLQRSAALSTEGGVRDALAGAGRADAVTPAFAPVPGRLEPGAELPVQLTVPLRGAPTESLALTDPGVYEVLVNVNGVPRDGGRARLAAVRLLLPVLSLPAGPGAPAVAAPSGPVTDLTVLYPLVDAPRRLPTVPGEQTLLTDDDLARSFAPDGRLGGLLAAFGERAARSAAVRDATCLAVDPDLVATAAAMRQGYAVRGPGGTTVPGSGAEAAGTWLDALAAAAREGCVLALPFADADLVALARGNLGDLARMAVSDGRTVVSEALGSPVLDGTTWPADGVLDEAALVDVAAAGGRAVVLGADAVGEGTAEGRAGRGGVVPLAGTTPVLAVLADPLLDRAAAAPGATTRVTTTDGAARAGAAAGTVPAATASPPLSTQDTIGTLVFRAGTATPGSGPLVLAPPHQWVTDAAGARALLDAVDLLFTSGRLRPRGLADVVAAGATTPGPALRPADPLRAGARDIPIPVIESVRELRTDVLDLRSAAVAETGVGAPLEATFGPLVHAAVRPTSSAWHGQPGLAEDSAADALARIGELRGSIRVLEPPSPYTLGTSDAPLLLTVANGLPVTVEVRLSISSTTGLRVAPIPTQRIPPLGRRQVQVSAEVVRSGQFSVEATVRTPSGRPLGPPSRLQVRSTAYGTITLWLTGCAGVLLVVLAAHRVVRRVRDEPGRSARTGPTVGGPPLPDPNSTPPDPEPPESAPPAGPTPTHPEPEPPTRPLDPPAAAEPPTRPPDPPAAAEPPTRPMPAPAVPTPPTRALPGSGPPTPRVPTRRP